MQKKTQISRLKEEIKFLYKKKDRLNESVYRRRPKNGVIPGT